MMNKMKFTALLSAAAIAFSALSFPVYADTELSGEESEYTESAAESVPDTESEEESTLDPESATESTSESTSESTPDSDTESVEDPVTEKVETDRVVMISDSYGVIAKSRTTQSWMQYLASDLNLTGADCTFRAYGSIGFCNAAPVAGLGNTTFLTVLEQLPADDQVTQVIVGGGFNDRFFNYSQMNAAMAQFKKTAKEKFPNAEIYVAFLPWYRNFPGEQYNIIKIREIYRIAAEENGIHYLDEAADVLKEHETEYLSSDNLHPNDDGNRALAAALAGCFTAKEQPTVQDLSDLTVTVSETAYLDDQTELDQSERTLNPPEISITDNTILLTEGKDYRVETSVNDAHTACTVTIQGIGNYTGSASGTASAAEPCYPMYRLYNRSSGEHFYTRSTSERQSLIRVGWVDEGIGWYAPISGKPVYRLYNPNSGDHHYTLSKNERDTLVGIGWKDEGIGWYSDQKQRIPVYRCFNPNETIGTHHYTLSREESRTLTSIGWKDEGTGWYAYPFKAS